MKIIITSLFSLFIIINTTTIAQVAINEDGSAPDNAAILDVKSTSKGFLPPRVSTVEMNAIALPPEGLMVYNTTLRVICWYNGAGWEIGKNKDGDSCGSVNYGGQTYNTVIIGSQCWLRENLNIGTRIDGVDTMKNNGTIEKYCYNDVPDSCDVYGGLYQWHEAMQYSQVAGVQGICPEGWHIPTYDEYKTLVTYLGNTAVAGGKMKETGYRHWAPNNVGATNSSGFTALGAGQRYYATGTFNNARVFNFLWTSTLKLASPLVSAKGLYLSKSDDDVVIGETWSWNEDFGLSVRCIKN